MTVRPARARALSALPAAALAALLLAGCTDLPEEANDNGPQPDPAQPGDVVRTPEPVEEAPPVVEETPADQDAEQEPAGPADQD